jgi:predicted ATPase
VSDTTRPAARRFVLTGTPGSGKTALLRALEAAGYPVVEEAATDVIALALADGDDETWTRPDFVDRVLALQVRRSRRADAAGLSPCLYDRSPVCTLALCRHLGRPVPPALANELDRIGRERVYEPRAFFVRSLGFVTPTAARRIGPEAALAFERIHEETYREAGFHLVDVPPAPLSPRVAGMLGHLPPPPPPLTGTAG